MQHMHQEGMKRFIIHVVSLSGQTPKLVPNGLSEGRSEWLWFLSQLESRMRVKVASRKLLDTKGRSVQAFSLACPDRCEAQRGRERNVA